MVSYNLTKVFFVIKCVDTYQRDHTIRTTYCSLRVAECMLVTITHAMEQTIFQGHVL